MKIVLFFLAFAVLGCKSNEKTVEPTGLVTFKVMVVSALEAMLAYEITFEPNSFSNAVSENPKKKGYFSKEKEISGAVAAILILPKGKLECVADKRGDKKAFVV